MSQSQSFGPGPRSNRGRYKSWDLDFRFFQEWGVKDGLFQALSPLYKENDLPSHLALTREISLPLEPLLEFYASAPFLSDAPEDLRNLIHKKQLRRSPRLNNLASDETLALAHSTEFQRSDGSWVAVREYLHPKQQQVYYAAEQTDINSSYPPAVRTNLFGAVNPAAGSLPDGGNFIVCNSPNRRNMYITFSKDGRIFDKTWFLLHEQLSDYTPGVMKREGGPVPVRNILFPSFVTRPSGSFIVFPKSTSERRKFPCTVCRKIHYKLVETDSPEIDTPQYLLIGWAQTDITPALPAAVGGMQVASLAKVVADPLTATALALEGLYQKGDACPLVLVSCDFRSISAPLLSGLRALLKKDLSAVPSENIILNGTHTHTASPLSKFDLPLEGWDEPDYVQWVVPVLALDYGIQIKGRSTPVQTFVVELAGAGSYIPTARSIEGGAYGAVPASTNVGPEGGNELVDWTVKTLNSLWPEGT